MCVILVTKALLSMQSKFSSLSWGSISKQLAEARRDFLPVWEDFALFRVFCKMSALYSI